VIEPEFLELMTQTVTVGQAVSTDEYGKRIRSTGVPYPCHVSVKSQEVAARAGGTITSVGQAWLAGYYPELDTADGAEVTGMGRVPIVAVQHVYDEAGPHHTVLHFGAS
jgi:hypothetical protein